MTGQDNDSIQEKLLWYLRSINMLHETLLETNAQQGIGALLQAIVRRAAELVGAQIGLMFLIRSDGESMELAAESTPDNGYSGRVYSIHEGICGTVARTGEPLAVEDYMSWDGQVRSSDHPPAGRVLAVPLKMGNQIIGVLFVGDRFKVGKFSDEEFQLINMFAEQAALALQNAQLHDAMRREIAERTAQLEAANRDLQADIAARRQAEALLELQRDIGVTLSSSDDLQTALQQCLKMIVETKRFQAGVIHILDEESKTLTLIAEVGLPDWARAHVLRLGEGSFEMDAIIEGKPVYLNDARFNSAFAEQFKRFGSLSAAAIPIRYEGKAIASLSVVSQHHREIDASSRLVLESVAAQIGGAIVRLRAEDAVKKSQENLQNLFDTMDDFLFVVDMQGRIAHVNPVVRERLGYSQDELIGRYGPDLISPREWQRVRPKIRNIAAGQPESYAVSLIPKEGKNIPVNAHGLRGRWDGREVIFCIGRDVAEQEEFETLLQNQRDLAVALSSIDDLDKALRCSLDAAMQIEGLDAGCIYLIDPNTDAMELKARHNLPDWFLEGMYCMGPEISKDHPLFKQAPVYLEDGRALPFSGDKVQRAGFRAIASVPVVHEGKITALIIATSLTLDVLPAKSRHALESIGVQIGGAIVRLQAEAERDEQRRMLRTLLDAMPDVVLFKDKDLRYVVANKKYCDMYGLSEKELVGKTDFEVMLLADDAERFRQEDLRVLAGETVLERHECQTPWGPRWDESIRVPLRDDRGEIIGVVVAARDITERMQVEEDRDSQRRMLRALLDHLPHHILFKDRDLVYRVINQGYCDFFGRPMDKLIGVTDLDVWPEEDARDYMEGERRLLETGDPIRMEKYTETRWGPNWREVIKNPLRDSTGNIIGILVAAHDITALKLADKQLRRRNEELSALNAISTTINQSLDPEFVLKTALQEVLALDMIGAEGRGEVFLLAEAGEALLVAQHGIPQAYLNDAKLRGKYLCNLVQQHGHVVVSSDDEMYEEGDVHGVDNVPHRNLSFPLRLRGRVLGCINLWLPVSKTLAQDDFLLLSSISDQISVAIENAHLYEDIRQQNLQIRALSRQVIESSENERKRVAQDLHDMIGQYLTALGINLNIIKQNLTPDAWDKTMSRLEDCTNLVERTTDYIRGVMADLRPPALDDYGLFAALMWLRDKFVKQADIQIDLIGQPLSERLAPHMEITLFRIAQEALTNVMKHAEASRVEVTLEESDSFITLQVKDNGVGFDSTQPAAPSEKGGWGLLTIKEWISGFGGFFEVKSAPGEGTLLRVAWPRQ